MEYLNFSPPEFFLGFEEMKPKQVEQFFQWYIAQSESRIKVLEEYYEADTGIRNTFDYTPESLIVLWTWYETKIETQERDLNEFNEEWENTPEDFRPWIPKNEFTDTTVNLIGDIAFYFAEVLLRNNEKLMWGYFLKPKKDPDAKKPVIVGFDYKMTLNPTLIVENCTKRALRNPNPRKLYETYMNWVGKYLEI